MRVPLLDFENPLCRHELDLASGEVTSREYQSESRAESRARGLAAYVKVGLRSRQRSFFAFYVYEGLLRLVVEGRTFDLSDPQTCVRRSSLAPFVKRFSVYQGEQCACSVLYWCSDLKEDGFVPRDFLSYVAREIAPTESHEKFVLFWEESAAGRDPQRPSFQEELSRRLRSQG